MFFHQPLPIYAAVTTVVVWILTAKGIVCVRKIPFDFRERFGCIDGLRGLLPLGVYLHHFAFIFWFQLTGVWQNPNSDFYVLSGHIGVGLFFMISGFLFWHKILVSNGRPDWKKLYLSRFFRIVPLYWCEVLAVLIVVFGWGGVYLKTSVPDLLKQLFDWFSFWGTPEINGFKDTEKIICGIVWTLRYEWFFYFSLPLLAWVLRVSKNRPLIIILFIGAIIFIGSQAIWIDTLQINTKFSSFYLAGALAAHIYRNERWRTVLQSSAFSFLGLIALAGIFLFFHHGYGMPQTVLLSVIFIPIAAGNSFFGILKWKSLLLLGEISYSLYLLHGFFLYAMFILIFPGLMRPGISSPALIAAMAVLSVIIVTVSYLTFVLIERPAIKYGKSLSN